MRLRKKRALITGITGQDGSYLAEILLDLNYEVHGFYRRSSTGNFKRLQEQESGRNLLGQITLHRGDLADVESVRQAVVESSPDEIYNLADQDNVDWSRETVAYSMDITAGAVGRLLEIVRHYSKNVRIFQPVTAMLFGNAPPPQDESTPFNPNSPYACAKAAAYYLCRYYRQAYGMPISVGIMYNHDSPRRSEEYLLHKICNSAVRIQAGKQHRLTLGDLSMPLNIGFARDYMRAAQQMLSVDPDDFVISTGESSTIGELVQLAGRCAGVENLLKSVEVDPKFLRPGPQPRLIGNSAKARSVFGFRPEFNHYDLVSLLVTWAKQRCL